MYELGLIIDNIYQGFIFLKKANLSLRKPSKIQKAYMSKIFLYMKLFIRNY